MKLSELMAANPEFFKKAKACKTKEELGKLFEENGIILQEEKLTKAFKAVQGFEMKTLSEDDLGAVSGGGTNMNAGGGSASVTIGDGVTIYTEKGDIGIGEIINNIKQDMKKSTDIKTNITAKLSGI